MCLYYPGQLYVLTQGARAARLRRLMERMHYLGVMVTLATSYSGKHNV